MADPAIPSWTAPIGCMLLSRIPMRLKKFFLDRFVSCARAASIACSRASGPKASFSARKKLHVRDTMKLNRFRR